jgi:predicted RNase H-like HicB family nuclease
MVFHVTLDKSEDGWIVVECPALPGCVSQGKDEQEALANIKEAIAPWLWAEDQEATNRDPRRKQPEILVSVQPSGTARQHFRQGSLQSLSEGRMADTRSSWKSSRNVEARATG